MSKTFNFTLLFVLFGSLIPVHAMNNEIVNADEKICPICYDILENQTETLHLPCRHVLCIKCWLNCIAEDISKCPLCRNRHFCDNLYHDFKQVNITNLICTQNYTSLNLENIFFYSCIYGNLDFCKIILSCGKINLDRPGDLFEITPLQAMIGSPKIFSEIKIKMLQYFLEHTKVNIYTNTWHGIVILHTAAYCEDLELIKYMLENLSFHINQIDDFGNTPIMFVLKSKICPINEDKKLKICIYLVEKYDADLTTLNSLKMCPLYYAIKFSYFEIFSYLTYEKCKSFTSDFIAFGILRHAPTEKDKLRLFQFLVKTNQFDINFQFPHGRSLIHTAVHFGSLIILQYASKYLDVNQQDNNRTTPLLCALLSEETQNSETRLQLIKFLVEEKQADLNIQNENKSNILFLSLYQGEFLILKYILDNVNIDINSVNEYGDNIAMLILESDLFQKEWHKLSYIRYLLKLKHLNFSMINHEGNNLLHQASYYGYFQIVEYLLDNTNLTLSQRNFDGITPPMCALVSQYIDNTTKFDFLKQIILQKSFDINAKDDTDWTILHYSIFYGNFEFTQYILNFFTNLNIHGINILSCLILSPYVKDGRLEMFKLLIEKYGLSIFETNRQNITLLHTSAFGAMDVFDYLVNTQNMNINQKDCSGNTPILHLLQNALLSEIDILKNVQHLVKVHHVHLDVRNHGGESAYKICLGRRFTTIANYIMTVAILKFVMKEVLML